MDMDNKKKQEQAIVEGQPTGGTVQEAPDSENTPSWMEMYAGNLSAAQDQYNKSVEAYNASLEAANTQREKVRKARDNGTSVIGAIWEERKPKYDEDKEKRLRQRAVIQSLGDMLSAAAVSVNAYGKRGMGYVPQMGDGSHLKSLEEINRMKEDYRKANEAWKEFEIKNKIANEEAKISAEEALLKSYEENAKENYKEAKDAEKAYNAMVNDYIKEGIKEENRAEEREWRDADREDRQANTAVLKAIGKGQASDLTEDGYIHSLLTADETFDEITEVPEEAYNDETGEYETITIQRKAIKPKTYTLAEHNARGKYDARVKKVKEYMKMGLSLEDAVVKVLAETKK